MYQENTSEQIYSLVEQVVISIISSSWHAFCRAIIRPRESIISMWKYSKNNPPVLYIISATWHHGINQAPLLWWIATMLLSVRAVYCQKEPHLVKFLCQFSCCKTAHIDQSCLLTILTVFAIRTYYDSSTPYRNSACRYFVGIPKQNRSHSQEDRNSFPFSFWSVNFRSHSQWWIRRSSWIYPLS